MFSQQLKLLPLDRGYNTWLITSDCMQLCSTAQNSYPLPWNMWRLIRNQQLSRGCNNTRATKWLVRQIRVLAHLATMTNFNKIWYTISLKCKYGWHISYFLLGRLKMQKVCFSIYICLARKSSSVTALGFEWSGPQDNLKLQILGIQCVCGVTLSPLRTQSFFHEMFCT